MNRFLFKERKTAPMNNNKKKYSANNLIDSAITIPNIAPHLVDQIILIALENVYKGNNYISVS